MAYYFIIDVRCRKIKGVYFEQYFLKKCVICNIIIFCLGHSILHEGDVPIKNAINKSVKQYLIFIIKNNIVLNVLKIVS